MNMEQQNYRHNTLIALGMTLAMCSIFSFSNIKKSTQGALSFQRSSLFSDKANFTIRQGFYTCQRLNTVAFLKQDLAAWLE